MPSSPELATLGRFVADHTLDDVPRDVVEIARLDLLDTLGARLAPSQLPEAAGLARWAATTSTGAATIVGHRTTSESMLAANVNGAYANWLEIDEGYHPSYGHPAIHVLPAALALAESRGATGRALLEALIAGYEVAARAGIACGFPERVHPHGTWGVLGAAAAAAKLLGHAADLTATTLDVACGLVSATARELIPNAATVKYLWVGMANYHGMLAAQLAPLGFTGERRGLGTILGQNLYTASDLGALVAGLSGRYAIADGYFKIHYACRYTAPSLEALDAVLASGPLDADSIERVEVRTIYHGARLDNREPKHLLAAKFSTPYALAAKLVTGTLGLTAFTPERLADPAIAGLMRRIHLIADPEYTAQYPATAPTSICVHLKDGQMREAYVTASRGDPDAPLDRADLEAKFHDVASPILGPATHNVVDLTRAAESLRSLADLSLALRGAP
ncbi:MAG: MmgE/PrpD family protein [Chloroflexi bacterium]|nr:MmgE/PrpD family protein [Chloroflexota bacterium]